MALRCQVSIKAVHFSVQVSAFGVTPLCTKSFSCSCQQKGTIFLDQMFLLSALPSTPGNLTAERCCRSELTMNRDARCSCPSIRRGVTAPPLSSSPTPSKEAADSQLIIYLPQKRSPSDSIRINKRNKCLQKILHPSYIYP